MITSQLRSYLFGISLCCCFVLGQAANGEVEKKLNEMVSKDLRALLDSYQKEYSALRVKEELACWTASTTGKKRDFDKCAKAQLETKKYHSLKSRFLKFDGLVKSKAPFAPVDARALEVAYLEYKGNQLPEQILQKMVRLSKEIEQTFNLFRARLGQQEFTNNDLLERLADEKDSAKREEMWKALKQVGAKVAPQLIKLAEVRNQAAKMLGYENYWDMMIRLQEYDPKELLDIFSELQKTTEKPFSQMKAQLDGELSRRFGVKVEAIMPWHYDNPFFQAAPPSEKVNLSEFYKNKKKEQIVEIARRFYQDIGFSVDDIIARSDLYERKGKDQHAFSEDIDRAGDVRTLMNIKPTYDWMETTLHELGHATYSKHIDRELPFNLRDDAHIFTTEGVAVMFGALAQNPSWMVFYAGADPKRVKEVQMAILEQRRRELLIFARWTMVMLYFEKAFYEDPSRDLNKLWWDFVENFQMLKRPVDRNHPDWAAKPHFTIAPVYYHNYMLGELFAAQLRHVLVGLSGHKGPVSELSFNGRKEFGTFLKDKVFNPGRSIPWSSYVKAVTGEPLTSKYFALELQ